VAEREYVWSDEGLVDATQNKVGLDEVEQALYAPAGDRVERTTTYEILSARALAGAELDEWRRHVL
jgi:hypothetical protein